MSRHETPSYQGHNWNWSKDALDEYVRDNYEKLSREDMHIGAVAISTLAAHARANNLFGKLPYATHIAAGKVPRGSALVAPLVKSREQGGYLDVSDYEENTTEGTRAIMAQLAIGQLGIWIPHQEEYAATNPQWGGSFQRAGQLAEGHVHQQDMRFLEANSTPLLVVEYGPESAADNEEEYHEFIEPICKAVEPGGLLVKAYVKESGRYDVGGIEQPAYSVTPDYVEKTLRNNNIDILFNGATDPSYAIRVEGDTHTYGGLGIAIGVKKR